ncbi:MAG: SurA N-terminal domain-containing protein [Bacteroidales bacterium]|nr:SurA N-terminal domain-containing protein [Bacteroidales bacterium]
MGIIGSIRKHSWIAVAVVGVAIVAFIIGDLTKNNRGIPDMGKINGTTISYQHFNELMEEMENNYKRQQGVSQVPTDVDYQIREQVWQNLVTETLTDEQFAKLGLTVSPAEVSDMYVGTFIHPYLRQSFTDPKTGVYQVQAIQYYVDNFENLDTAQRMEWMELEKAVKADRKQQKYSALIARGMYMPNAIAKQIAEMGNKLSNVTAVNCSYQSVDDSEITLSEEDYQKYYNKHKAEFRLRDEMREIEYIVYPIAPTTKDMEDIATAVQSTWEEFQTVDADELLFFVNSESDRSYDSTYRKASEFASPMDSALMAAGEGSFISPRIAGNEWMMAKVLKIANRPDSLRASAIYIFNDKVGGNITRGDEQAKQLADSVSNLVKSGAMTFEQAVEQYSDDPQKANNNGDMEWQLDGGYGFLNEEIINTPEGGVFVMQHPNEVGYFVVKVTGKTSPHRKYRVATIARTIAASEATTRNIYNEANKFAGNNRTYAEMTAGAQQENLQVRNAMVTPMQYSVSGINNARSIVQWAFNEKTEKGAVADQIFEADDMYIVAALKDVYKVGYATLDQVRSMIENQVRNEKKGELLMARMEEAKKANADIYAIATKVNSVVDTLDSVSFNDYFLGKYGMEPKVQSAIAAAAENTLVGPIQGAQGVYMVKVNAKMDNPTPVDPATIRSQKEQSFMQGLRSVQQVLKDNAKVVDQRNKFF